WRRWPAPAARPECGPREVGSEERRRAAWNTSGGSEGGAGTARSRRGKIKRPVLRNRIGRARRPRGSAGEILGPGRKQGPAGNHVQTPCQQRLRRERADRRVIPGTLSSSRQDGRTGSPRT